MHLCVSMSTCYGKHVHISTYLWGYVLMVRSFANGHACMIRAAMLVQLRAGDHCLFLDLNGSVCCMGCCLDKICNVQLSSDSGVKRPIAAIPGAHQVWNCFNQLIPAPVLYKNLYSIYDA